MTHFFLDCYWLLKMNQRTAGPKKRKDGAARYAGRNDAGDRTLIKVFRESHDQLVVPLASMTQ